MPQTKCPFTDKPCPEHDLFHTATNDIQIKESERIIKLSELKDRIERLKAEIESVIQEVKTLIRE